MKKPPIPQPFYPRENGYYKVRWAGEIQPAQYCDGKWWFTNFIASFTDEEIDSENIGDRIDCGTLNN